MTRTIKRVLIGFLIFISIIALMEVALKAIGYFEKNAAKKNTVTNVIPGGPPSNGQGKQGSSNSNGGSNAGTPQIITREQVISSNNYSEYDQISNYLDKYFELVNNKKFAEAYNLLDPDFQKIYYPTVEKFTGYINNTYNTGKAASITSYMKQGNIYYCTVRIFSDIVDGNDPTNLVQQETFTLYVQGENKFKLAFDGFVYFKSINNISATMDKVKFSVVNVEKDIYSIKYNVKVDNYQDQPLSLLDLTNKNIYYRYETSTSNSTEYLSDNSIKYQDFKVAPKTSKNFTFEFANYTEKPLSIEISNITIGDKTQNVVIHLN